MVSGAVSACAGDTAAGTATGAASGAASGTTSGVGSELGSATTGGTATGAATGAASVSAGGAGASTSTDSGAASACAGVTDSGIWLRRLGLPRLRGCSLRGPSRASARGRPRLLAEVCPRLPAAGGGPQEPFVFLPEACLRKSLQGLGLPHQRRGGWGQGQRAYRHGRLPLLPGAQQREQLRARLRS